jgi:hypothetical protein
MARLKTATLEDQFMARFAEMSPEDRRGTLKALTIICEYEEARELRQAEPKDDTKEEGFK